MFFFFFQNSKEKKKTFFFSIFEVGTVISICFFSESKKKREERKEEKSEKNRCGWKNSNFSPGEEIQTPSLPFLAVNLSIFLQYQSPFFFLLRCFHPPELYLLAFLRFVSFNSLFMAWICVIDLVRILVNIRGINFHHH